MEAQGRNLQEEHRTNILDIATQKLIILSFVPFERAEYLKFFTKLL